MPKPTNKSDIETALEKLKEAHKSQDLAAIDTALNDINAAWQAASQDLYNAQSAANAEANSASSSSGKNDDGGVQDVDFEEVK